MGGVWVYKMIAEVENQYNLFQAANLNKKRKATHRVGLVPISAQVPAMFLDDKEHFGTSWAYIIKEGIQAMKLKETLMTGKYHDDNWRDKARTLLAQCLEHEKAKLEREHNAIRDR